MLGGWEWLILLVVVLLLFGTKRLPEMARSIGQSARVFKGEMKGMKSDDEPKGRAEEPPRSPGRAALPPAGHRPGHRPVPRSSTRTATPTGRGRRSR